MKALLVTAGFLLPAALWAQTVTQGSVDQPSDQTVFHFPMVIETVFAASDRSLWTRKDEHENGRDWFTVPEYHALGKFRCDGIAVRGDTDRKHEWDTGLFLSARDLPDGNVEIGIWAKVFNPRHNHDKLVTLVFEIVNGESVVAKVAVPPVKARDRDEPQDVKALAVVLPASAFVPSTKLRITVTTQDY